MWEDVSCIQGYVHRHGHAGGAPTSASSSELLRQRCSMASSQVAVMSASLRVLIAESASALMGEKSMAGVCAGVGAGTGVGMHARASAYGAMRCASGVSPG